MKKKFRKLVVFIILPAFLLQGCGVWMVDKGTVRADKPYETTEPRLLKTEKGREVVIPSHWEIVDNGGIPAGMYPYPKFDMDPVWKVNKDKPNTFKAVEEYAKNNGLAILKTEMDFPAKMTSGHKPPKIYLIPKGKYIMYKPEEQTNGDIILSPVEVPSCRNELVWAPKIKWVPRTKVRVDKEIWATTKRYRDVNTQVDAGASALWFLGGLATGIGLGYLFWFGSGAASSSAVINNCSSGACGAGGPAIRPLP